MSLYIECGNGINGTDVEGEGGGYCSYIMIIMYGMYVHRMNNNQADFATRLPKLICLGVHTFS